MTTPLTGWLFTDATRQCDCHKCGAIKGDNCVTPKGRKTNKPHSERINTFINSGRESRFYFNPNKE